MGTRYEINTSGKILFIEDVGEAPYRIDRMLTQLKTAGKLEKANAIVFGKCEDCTPDLSASTWDLSLGEVLDNILSDLRIPVFYGLTFGHTKDQFTIPEGVEAELDADSHTLTITENACI
jgi:muramoyltetrapeptide carboxypeptidase